MSIARIYRSVSAATSQGQTELEAAAGALSSNQAALFTMGGVADISNDASSSIFEYVSRASWDAGAEKIRFIGIQHQSGWAQYLEYDAAGDAWSQETVPNSPNDPRHGYCGFACNSSGLSFFHQGNSGTLCHKRTSSGTWSTHNNPQSGWAQVEWHPGLSKFVIGQIWGIRTFDPSDNSFATLRDTPGGTDMTDGPGVSAYSQKDSCVYVGNTEGTNAKIWKVNGSGTCTQIANPPVAAAVHYASANNAMLIGPANSSNKLLAIRQNGEAYEYDEVGNSWGSDISGGAFPSAVKTWIQGATKNQWIACSIPAYGVIAFMREISGDVMDPDMYLWKH